MHMCENVENAWIEKNNKTEKKKSEWERLTLMEDKGRVWDK